MFDNTTLRLLRPMIPARVRLKLFEIVTKSGYSTKVCQQSINEAELVGTIHKQLYTSPKFRSYLIQTAEPDSKFYYHMVGTDRIDHYPIGQRVHVAGRINSQNYWSEDGKQRQKIILNSNLFRPLPNGGGHNDLNRVRMLAQISSEIQNNNTHSSFTMRTERTRGGANVEATAVEHHRILVRDPAMLQIVREKLSKGDWAAIDGKISYTFWKNSLHKLRQSGYILANFIHKEENIF